VNIGQAADILGRKSRAYNALFHATGEGRELNGDAKIFLTDIIEFCQPYATTHIAGPDGKIDPIQAAVQEGKRSVYNHIIKRLKLDDLKVIEMAQQQQEAIQNDW
jgi:hypothetical protein